MEEQKKEETQDLKFFKIPHLSQGVTKATLIGVVDSSWSMSGYWKRLSNMWNQFTTDNDLKELVVFSDRAERIEDCQHMADNINLYYPGGTNISSGFEKLNQILKLEKTLDNVTVLFVSDGGDNAGGSLQDRLKKLETQIKAHVKINFLTVGVGSGFPTKIAMQLRNMYHSGEVNIPPLFLVDDPNKDECWVENFSKLSTYLCHKSEITLKSTVKAFPWSESTKLVYENSWVLTENSEQLEEVEGKLQLKPVENFGIYEMVEILKQWLGELQLLSLKKKVQEESAQACKIIQQWKILIETKIKQGEKKKLTFHEKMLKKVKTDIFSDFHVLAKEIKALADDNILDQLNEQEAAKRLAIGTQLGKYHTTAIKIRGLSVEQFQEAQNYFVKLFSEVKISEETEQEPSIISLQTQKDVLLETDFIEGIKLCPSQYTLVESLPLVGHAIQLKRTDGSMINPYLVTVVDMARHHKVVDTVSIQNTENNELVLKTGDGDEEVINAVIPLYTEKDKDLKPILTSKLFQILMTFNVMQNADTCFDTAYIALQANTLMYLIQQTQSEWRENMLEQLLTTLKVTYADSQAFKFHNKAVLETPRTAVITEHPDIKTKCEDLSKTLLHLFFHVRANKLENKEKIQEILQAIFMDVFGRAYPNETELKTFFKMKNAGVLENIDFSEYVDDAVKNFPEVMNFYSIQEIREELSKRLVNIEIKTDQDFSVELDTEKLFFLQQGKFSLEKLRKIEEFFLGHFEGFESILTEQNFVIWLRHATIRNSRERNSAEIDTDYEKIMKILQLQKQAEILSKNTIFDKAIKVLEVEYKKKMNETHRYFMPFNLQTLAKELYKQKNTTLPEHYRLNSTSCMLTNACVAPECPHFLKLDNRLSSHRQGIDEIAAFCKTIYLKRNVEDTSLIFNAIINGECIDPYQTPVYVTEQNIQEMLDNKDKFLKIIQQMRDLYKNL